MIHKIKAVGIATIAMLAMTATMASVVQAAKFSASSYPMTVTASSAVGNGQIKTEGGNVECAEHLQGTLSASSETIAMTPTFSSCKAFGFLAATVHGNGCLVTLYANGQADLNCPAGKVVQITSGSCVIHVMSQNNLTLLNYKNTGTDIEMKFQLSNLTYFVTTDGFGCPFFGPGHRTGMSWIWNQYVTTAPVGAGTYQIIP